MTIEIKSSIFALLAGFVPTTASGARAQTETTDEASFADLIAREVGAPGGLTADEAARRTAKASPSIRARNEELVAAAEVDRATAAYVPQVTLSGSYMRLSDTGGGSAGNIVAAPGAPAGPIAPGTPLVNVPLAFDTPLLCTRRASISSEARRTRSRTRVSFPRKRNFVAIGRLARV